MNNPRRQPNPNAPHPSTFLWAHELRRENIQVVNQLNRIRADLAVANDTIGNLNHKLERLDLQAREEIIRLENSLKELEARFDTNLRTGIERVEELENENRQLRGRIDGLERHAREQVRMEDGIRVRVLDEVRDMMMERGESRVKVELGIGMGRGDVVKACSAGSDVLVPDSMPMGSVPGVGGRSGLSSTLSDTTWGTPSLVGEKTEEVGTELEGVVKQGGRSLADYFAAAEGMRRGLQAQRDEGEVVRAVVRGLDDSGIRALIEEEISHVGWSWSALRAVMLKVMEDREMPIQEPVKESEMPNCNVKVESTNAHQVQHKRQRTRRYIPIVPADEEDERIVMEMYRH
ncbi:similar to An02g11670 [Aspergillus luchuensis]|uniref:Similar to An02g11670 n=1 Tax=Aspergillus kawachii TaxID=1069201 RepID=A0A146FCT7_ASPKA|nr:similar to An02g11670 [Aspergillus luchuensis]